MSTSDIVILSMPGTADVRVSLSGCLFCAVERIPQVWRSRNALTAHCGRGSDPERDRERSLASCQPAPHCALQEKLAASLVEPEPLYTAICGYGHSGRVMSTWPLVTCEARIWAGA